MIVVYRSRKKQAIGSTKSDRFRSVEIGPALCAVLGDQLAQRAELASDERADSILFVMPVRTIKRSNGRWESTGVARPLDRNTVSRDWHKHALEDAALRDMPLHVDFLRLKPGTRIRVDVPVRFINHEAAPGLKRGGSLNIVRHTVEMQVPADNIPASLTADLTGRAAIVADDVLRSGTSLRAVARAARSAGAKSVLGIAAVRTLRA